MISLRRRFLSFAAGILNFFYSSFIPHDSTQEKESTLISMNILAHKTLSQHESRFEEYYFYDLLQAKAYFYIYFNVDSRIKKESKVHERSSLRTKKNLYVNAKYNRNIKLFSACKLRPFYAEHL